MKDMGIIQGSAEQAFPLIIGKDTVYEHTQIEQILKDSKGNSVDNLFKYHEIQYDKNEYIKNIAETNKDLTAQMEVTQEVIDVILLK